MNTVSATRLRDQLDEICKMIDDDQQITGDKKIDTEMSRIYDAMVSLSNAINSR